MSAELVSNDTFYPNLYVFVSVCKGTGHGQLLIFCWNKCKRFCVLFAKIAGTNRFISNKRQFQMKSWKIVLIFFGPIFFWLVCIHKLNVWYHRRPPGCQFDSSDWFSFFWSICSIYIKYVVFFQFENDLPHNQTKSINWFWIIFDTGLGRSILIRVSCSYWPNAASLSSNDLTLFVDFGCRLFSKIADVFDFGNEIN